MRHWRSLLLTTTALLATGPAAAGPDGANVVGGSATITGQGSASVTINQTSSHAIINWQHFNIGAGELTQFNQPSSSSVALNRVTGGLGPTEILGTLRANGRVFVVNQDGIYFGPNAVIDTAGFLATTSDIRNSDFMAGRYNFNIPGRPDASIVNRGTITAHSAGFAALVAPGVRNTGTITATLGTVGLAAGNSFTLDFYGDKLITLAVGDQIAAQVRDVHTGRPLSSLVENSGRLSANGGRVELTAAAARRVVDSVINNRGVIEANRIGTRGGQIILSAATGSSKPAGAPKQTIRLGGTLSASGKKSGEKGGKIVVQGENIEVAGARIDVSGVTGGGTVLIGGDWGGGNPDTSLVSNPSARLEGHKIANAATVTVDAATVIDASATESGNGGKVVLWADERMSFAGTITATGGPRGGDGGFAEVSGKQTLDYTGLADLRAPKGSAGTLLLDPYNVTIDNVGSNNGSFSGGTWTPNGTSFLNVVDLQNQLNLGNVVVTTNGSGTDPGDISVFASVAWNNSNTLTLSAHRNIVIDDAVITNTGAGNLILRADSQGGGIGTIDFDGTGAVNFAGSTGRVSIYYNPPGGYTTPTDFTEAGQGTGLGVLNGSQLTSYMLVNSGTNLQSIGTSTFTLNQTYALGRDFDGSIGFNGFAPGTTFTGTLDGFGGIGPIRTISNLSLSTAVANTSYGLFPFIGASGVVRNLNLSNVSVSAGANSQFIGAVAGNNAGTIANVTMSGAVTNGGSFTNVIAGGLVGQTASTSSITNALSSATVSVGDAASMAQMNTAGGLVGVNAGTITDSASSGNVSAGTFSFVGGLVGRNDGTITASAAFGNVSGNSSSSGNSTAVGGFAGANSGTIADSFAFGNVSGDGPGSTVILGGFVGLNGLTGNLPNPPTGLITNSEAHGSVAATGDGQAGGFVGGNFATIQSSRAFGSVSAEGGNAGGFVGMNFDPGSINDSFAVGNVAVGTPGNFDDVTAGGFAGENEGVISNSKASGAVTGVAEVQTLGGFVGANNGVIESASASGNVTGNGSAITIAGGFAGGNALGEILESSATGSVSATGPLAVAGGFIGLNIGLVGPSFATGNVDVSGAQFGFGGGFAGWNLALIGRSFATGAVTGGENSFLGGFASLNLGEIFQAYATSPTTGGANSTVGGLLALNFGTVDQTYATGLVSAGNGSRRGGLVAANDYTAFLGVLPQDAQQLFANTLPTGTATNSYWDTQSTGQTTSAGGEGRTTAQLVNGLPPGFSTDVWTIKAGQSYPFFNGQSDPIPTPRDHFVQGDVNQAQYLNNVQLTAYQNQNPTVTPPVVTLPKGRASKKGAGNKPNPGNNNQQFRPDGRPSNIPPLNETRFIANQVLVQIGANVPPAVLDRVVRQLGLKVVSTQTVGLLGTRMIQFEFGKGKNIRAVIKELEKQRIIDEATPNYEFELAQDATAPAGNGSGDPAQYVIGKLRLAEAHRLATGENVLVAVIDSEIDAKHPDIDGRIAARYEEAGPVEKPHPHGTGMAGAIVSHRKLMGTAPGARILAIRAFGGATGGAKGTTVQIVKGLDWAVGQNARIVNMSFAGPKDPTLARAFKAAFDKGVVLIAAAGNAGPKSPPLYPGADPSVIAVSATDADDKIYANSNRGSYVTVASPGVDILVPAPEGGYEFTTGTSVAAAHVSGIAALLLQRDPKLDAAGVREILATTANPLGSSGRSNEFGYGLVDPLKALQVAGAKTSGLPTPATVAAAGR